MTVLVKITVSTDEIGSSTVRRHVNCREDLDAAVREVFANKNIPFPAPAQPAEPGSVLDFDVDETTTEA